MGLTMTEEEEEVAQLLVGLRHEVFQRSPHVESISSSENSRENTKNKKRGRCSGESDCDPYCGGSFLRNWSSKRRRTVRSRATSAALVSDADAGLTLPSLRNDKSTHRTRLQRPESDKESYKREVMPFNGAYEHTQPEIPNVNFEKLRTLESDKETSVCETVQLNGACQHSGPEIHKRQQTLRSNKETNVRELKQLNAADQHSGPEIKKEELTEELTRLCRKRQVIEKAMRDAARFCEQIYAHYNQVERREIEVESKLMEVRRAGAVYSFSA